MQSGANKMTTRRRVPLQQKHQLSTIADHSLNESLSNVERARGGRKSLQPVASTSATALALLHAEAAGDNMLDEANISDDEEGGTRIGDIYIPPPLPPHCSTESKGPRLIIKKIENKNFKSYAGTVVLGPFHHVSYKKCNHFI